MVLGFSLAAKYTVTKVAQMLGFSESTASGLGNCSKWAVAIATADAPGIIVDWLVETSTDTVAESVLAGYPESDELASAGGAEAEAATGEESIFIDEESYAQACPALSPDNTEAYCSDEELEDEATDGSALLLEALPYMAMAVAAYKSKSMIDSMEGLFEGFVVKRSQVIQNVIDPTHLFGSRAVGRTDTEVHVSILEDETVVLAFRGTEPTEWSIGFADVLTDLDQKQELVKLYDGSKEPVYSSPAAIQAHRGFQLGLKDVTDNLNPTQNLRLVLDTLKMQARDVRRVMCVGHSLGGALATLCAKWCRAVAFPEAKIGCVTIGSPRVGNVEFARDFNDHVVDWLNYRVVNKRDVVPCIPNLLTYPRWKSAYKHVGQPIYLCEDDDGQISALLGGGRPNLVNLGFLHHPGMSYITSATAVDGIAVTGYVDPQLVSRLDSL